MNDVLGKVIADKYRAESLIREDGAGDLFTGVHESLGRAVTLKVLPPAVAVDQRWVKRFVAEARAASSLSHPNILGITDFGTDSKGVSYAVFEPTDGRTLRDVTDSGESIEEDRAIAIAQQIAGAVAAAHAAGSIHGSLSPQNVFMTGPDTVKVYGFGADPLAVAHGADVRYLAPEQCNAYPVADQRSDVYSLGVMLYEMLAGVRPYEGKTAADILERQNSEPPAPLTAFRRDLHADLEPIVLSAMAVDPERRYQDMASFAEDLGTLGSNIGTSQPAAVAAVAGTSGPRKNIWQTAVFVVAGIAIFAAALIYATSVRKTDPTQSMQADAGSLPVQPIGPATGAQEESLAKLPAMTDAEILATSNPDMLPGGDGFNAWANGGLPPTGAPLAGSVPGSPSGGGLVPPMGYVPQGGQVYTVDGGSQFMPESYGSGVELRCKDMQTGQEIPCPTGPPPSARPSPTPRSNAANTAVPTDPEAGKANPAATPKPLMTPPGRQKPAAEPADKTKATPAKPKPSGEQPDESPAGQ